MRLTSLELSGFKSFARKSSLSFDAPVTAIVGPNGSGKSNIAEAFRFVLGEQSFKSMRGRRGEDLIFGGSPGSPRAGRAAVKVVFDNSDHTLNVDFNEVTVERIVHRDGVNSYLLNGSQVRLRDIYELLAGANIGASAHHIISQGQADRVLSANIRERREMVEEALGLKIYQYKKEESQKKLEKTRENIKEVELMRREIAPHLKFLKGQVEKVEKARAQREELRACYRDYLKREQEYIAHEEQVIARSRALPEQELADLEAELAKARQKLADTKAGDAKSTELLELERKLADARGGREQASRELGRIEGQLDLVRRQRERAEQQTEAQGAKKVLLRDVESVRDRLKTLSDEAANTEDAASLRALLARAYETVANFIEERARSSAEDADGGASAEEFEQLTAARDASERRYTEAKQTEDELERAYQRMQEELSAVRDESRDAEREIFRITTKQGELRAALQSLEAREAALAHAKTDFKRELEEGGVLIGRSVFAYEEHDVLAEDGRALTREELATEERERQEERRRHIEKLKIRLEETGSGSGEEIMKEYGEVSERDAFLARELADLGQSAEKLLTLIAELEEKLDVQFREGVRKINTEFNSFFTTLFEGGSAELKVIKEQPRRKKRAEEDEEGSSALLQGEEFDEEEEEVREGIDIVVSLPRKRIRGLEVLSGGERSLTSIALIFAMSQVNPPPFLILDETDAALDEANSRKYGDMIERLAKRSQLILITHNRETMSRAGVLYGTTMGTDAISRLLSIKLEEATAVAA